MTDAKDANSADLIQEWYRSHREHFFFESMQIGWMRIYEYAQPGGICRTPPQGSFHLLVPLKYASEATIVVGGERVARSSSLPGQMIMTDAREDVRHEHIGDAHGLVFDLPVDAMIGLGDELQPRIDGGFGPLHASFWRDNRIRDCALDLWRSARSDPQARDGSADEMAMSLLMMLLARAQDGFAPRDLALAMAPNVRRRVIEYVEDNIGGDCSLYTLAGVAGLSPFHFARVFRAELGDTPHRYVTRRRVARARDLIVNTTASLAAIALATGFSSQSRMTEAFVRHLGITPGRLRIGVEA